MISWQNLRETEGRDSTWFSQHVIQPLRQSRTDPTSAAMRELHGPNPTETEIDFDNIELYIAPRGRQGTRGRSRSASPGRRQAYQPPEAIEGQEGPPRYGMGPRFGGRGRGSHFETQKFPLGRGGGTYKNATLPNRREELFPGAFRDIINKKAGTTKPTIKTTAHTQSNTKSMQPPQRVQPLQEGVTPPMQVQEPNRTSQDSNRERPPKTAGRTPPGHSPHSGHTSFGRGYGTSPKQDKKPKKNPNTDRTPNRSLFSDVQRMDVDPTADNNEVEHRRHRMDIDSHREEDNTGTDATAGAHQTPNPDGNGT